MQDQQHIVGTESGNQEEARVQEEHQIEDNADDAQIMGEQSDNEHQILEVEKAEHNSGKNTDQEPKDIDHGVSSQKRVRIKAEQLFEEGQANKAIQKQEALNKQL
eukprot:441438-Heterocapsa_arctica.AAC.1